ncbi:MAG: chromosome partitioning protein, ParB family [Parcubacteria group bacterium LiPW_72]|nr:MAG: chromosome partitioning protein, ParB family [Parcubacteria group bacterium LiPW_72]
MPHIGLGRGLSALIPNLPLNEKSQDMETRSSGEEILISEIKTNPNQPRKEIDQEKLLELASSIKIHGILQPLIVNENYELIAGQRRLEAAKLAGLKRVPVAIRTGKESDNLEMSIIENVQREDLNPIEEAEGYRSLIQKFGLAQNEVAKRVGKNRSTVTNILRLLDLPIEIQKGIREEKISEGHAKLILGLANPEKQLGLYKKIIQDSLSVRKTEEILKKVTVKRHLRKIKAKDPSLVEAEELLQEALGTRVKVSRDGRVGRITIEFYSDEELEGILGKVK